FREAAKNGHSASIYELALCLETGYGCKPNQGQAVKWFQKAADQGNVRASFKLALARGEEAEMASLATAAAGGNCPEGPFVLGQFYAEGTHGFTQDDERAAEWVERAADHNYPPAMRCLGERTIEGRGVRQNVEKGWDLLQRAARLGDTEAAAKI